jgi:hypothetical protein
VQTPTLIDFGTVYVGGRPAEQTVTLRFSDGSRIACARILTEGGPFWYTGPARYRDVLSIDIRIFGQPMPEETLLGSFAGRLRVQMDEVIVTVHLKVIVEPVPQPPPPVPDPVPEPISALTPPRRPSGVRLGFVLLALVLVVAVIVGVMAAVNIHSTHPAAPSAGLSVASVQPRSKYCSVASSDGQVLSYYLTKPGVAKQAAAGTDPIWSVMAPTSGDDYLTWWTPAFPYWERANLYDGFTDDAGTEHGKFGYVEVLAYYEVPWLPLPEVFQRYPEVSASAEVVQRKLFIQKWSKELGSPPCR